MLIQHSNNFSMFLYLGGMWSDVDLKMDTHNSRTRDMLKRDSTTCSKYAHHSRFNMIETQEPM